MAAGDVAGAIRARALARRRIGSASARRLACAPDLPALLGDLARTPYGRYVRPGQSLAEAEHAVLATLLWHLRVLAGWQSRSTAERLRTLAGGFELANRAESLAGAAAEQPFELGALASSRGGRAESRTPAESPWGDPGADSGWALSTLPRLSWLRRVATRVPVAAPWASGAALLLLARDRLIDERPVTGTAVSHLRTLTGVACLTARTLPELRSAADRRARWVLAGVDAVGELWRAEVSWWQRVEKDGTALLHTRRLTGDAAIGCAAVLAVDAWRTRAALESAALGGNHVEVFDGAP